MEVVEFFKSIKDFVYSPPMIGVQVFSVLISLSMAFLLARIIKDTGNWERRWKESRVSLKQGVEQDNIQQEQVQDNPLSRGVLQQVQQGSQFFQEHWDAVDARDAYP